MRVTLIVLCVVLAGCATSQGQVGSNAAYVYEKTDEGCRVTVYSGREQIESAVITISQECELSGEVKAVSAGQTNDALIRVIERLAPAE